MLARRTVNNRIALPKAVNSRFADVNYFEVTTDGDSITLHPLQRSRADAVRAKLDELGINDQDLADAITWARQSA